MNVRQLKMLKWPKSLPDRMNKHNYHNCFVHSPFGMPIINFFFSRCVLVLGGRNTLIFVCHFIRYGFCDGWQYFDGTDFDRFAHNLIIVTVQNSCLSLGWCSGVRSIRYAALLILLFSAQQLNSPLSSFTRSRQVHHFLLLLFPMAYLHFVY